MEGDKEYHGEERMIVIACDTCKKLNTIEPVGTLIEEYEKVTKRGTYIRGKLIRVTMTSSITESISINLVNDEFKDISHICVSCYKERNIQTMVAPKLIETKDKKDGTSD